MICRGVNRRRPPERRGGPGPCFGKSRARALCWLLIALVSLTCGACDEYAVREAAAQETRKDPTALDLDFSAEERRVLQTLVKRKIELDKREAAIEAMKLDLGQMRKEIEARILFLQQLKAEIEKDLTLEQELKETREALASVKEDAKTLGEEISKSKEAYEEQLKKLTESELEDLETSRSARRLTLLLESMRPEDAAGMLVNMDIETAAKIIGQMNQRKAGKILAAFDPAMAAKIGKLLTEQ